ncbi:UNVERIFIED_CONTAM: hypothetical protein FKN15_016244 [Acipenser sinensis]
MPLSSPRPSTVLWSRLNDSLPERTETQGTLLTVPRLSALDNGTYVCEGHNQYGRAADEYTLVVYGSYLTHEASGLDEHGEVQEAFLNGSETREGKKEYLL